MPWLGFSGLALKIQILYYIIPLVSFNIIRNSDVDVVDQIVLKMNIKCWGGGKQRISEYISI